MSDENTKWYKLDNAGKLFPSISSDVLTTVYRLSATLIEELNLEMLQLALKHMIERCPYFRVHLKRGFFWYYFESTTDIPEIEEEKYYPCVYLLYQKRSIFPFRIIYYKTRISLEMAHCLTDGTGALIFFKSLLYEYFKLIGIKSEPADDILKYEDKPDLEEYEDAFKKYYNKIKTKVVKMKKAFHFPFSLCQKGTYHIVTGIIPVKKILKISKKHKTSLTAFITTVFFETIIDFIKSYYKINQNQFDYPIALNIPVNLRNIFKSKTMRNFFLSLNPAIYPPFNYTFEEIISNIQKQIEEQIKKDSLISFIQRNVKGEKSIFIRMFPLILKDAFLPFIYNAFGENLCSSNLSNLGRISISETLDKHIERVEFYPPPSTKNLMQIGITSFKENLFLTFGKLTEEKEIEKIFFRKLIKMGIPVKIETN